MVLLDGLRKVHVAKVTVDYVGNSVDGSTLVIMGKCTTIIKEW